MNKVLVVFLMAFVISPARADYQSLTENQKVILAGSVMTHSCWAQKGLIPKDLSRRLIVESGESVGLTQKDFEQFGTGGKYHVEFMDQIKALAEPYGGTDELCEFLAETFEASMQRRNEQ